MNDVPKIYRFATNLAPGKDGPGDTMQVREFVLATEWFDLRAEYVVAQRKAIILDELMPKLAEMGIVT